MSYLDTDIAFIKTNLVKISNSSAETASNTSSIASSAISIDSNIYKLQSNVSVLESTVKTGLQGIENSLDNLSLQMDELIDITKDLRDRQFIQNEERNALLSSIDETLKAPNKAAANEKFEISLELLNKGKVKHALKMLEEAIELNPIHYRSYVQLTLIHLQLKNYPEALRYAKESLDFMPPNQNEINAYTYYLLARTYEKNNEIELALQHIDRAVHFNRQGNYYYEKARYHSLLNNGPDTIRALSEAIKADEKYFALSLIDPAFNPYRQEQEQLLTALKQEAELKINNAIEKLSSVTFPKYQITSGHLDPNQFYDYNNGAIYEDALIEGIKGQKIIFCYRNFVDHFCENYDELKNKYEYYFNQIEASKQSGTYSSFVKAFESAQTLQSEFNHLSDAIERFMSRFVERGGYAKSYFSNEVILYEYKANEAKIDLPMGGKWLNIIRLPHEKKEYKRQEEKIEEYLKSAERYQMLKDDADKDHEQIKLFTEEMLVNSHFPKISI